jgi:CubicO group peptidase (beta-lactamase class C family)
MSPLRTTIAAAVLTFVVAGCADDPGPVPGPGDAPAPRSVPTRSERPRPAYDFAAVDRLLSEAAPRLSGCALLLVKDGEIIYRRSFGGYRAEQIIPIASATKWLSGAVIMSLVDDGTLSLDDPVSKYLSSFTGPKAGITVRQLFSHTSGLPPEIPCRNDKGSSLARCAEQAARLPMRAAPGSEFRYGGVSMHVAGRVAEVASGMEWSDLFRTRIAEPAGLQHTDYFAYGVTANPRVAGDGRGTLDDYGRFLTMILNGGEIDGKRVLSEAAIAEMRRDQTAGAPIRYTIYQNFGHLNPALPRARYGIGVWREVVDDRTGEVVEISSQGALGFSPWIDFERNLAGVLAVRSSQTRIMPVYLRLKEAIRGIVPPDAAAP